MSKVIAILIACIAGFFGFVTVFLYKVFEEMDDLLDDVHEEQE